MNWLIRASLQRAAVVILATLLLLGGGVFAATRLNIELLPTLSIPVLTIVTPYPGATPEDVNTAVTVPVEGAIAGSAGLRTIRSTSSEGYSAIIAEFAFGTDLDAVERQVNSTLAATTLPPGAGRPQLSRVSLDTDPVITAGLLGDDLAALQSAATGRIAPELRGLPGVAQVNITGGARRELRLSLDPRLLRERGVTPEQVAGALAANNLAAPVGTIAAGPQRLPVRAAAELASIEQVRALVVGVTPPTEADAGAGGQGTPVRLRDVATVELVDAPGATIARVNGRPSIGLEVVKARGSNTVAVADAVRARLADLRARGALPTGADFRIVSDQSPDIRDAIEGLLKEGLAGAFFAVLTIFLFLRNVRSTLVAAVSIPTSVLAALVVMERFGLTLNILTLGGLAIAIGRVVDDAIVVLENIYRRHEGGEPIGTAVIEGTREVAGAIFASTITTVAVFIPLGFIGGLVGEAFRPFALTVAFALLASLLVALTIVPVLARLFLGRAAAGGAGEREGVIERLYGRALRWGLAHRAAILLVAVALLGGSLALVPGLPTAFFPPSPRAAIVVEARAASGTGQATLDALARRLETEVARGAGIETYRTVVGIEDRERAGGAEGGARARVAATYRKDTDVGAEVNRLRAALAGLPGAERVEVAPQEDDFGGGSRLELAVAGADQRQVAEASGRVLEAVRRVAGVTAVTSDLTTAQPEVRVAVDPARAAERGLSAATLAEQIRALLGGGAITEVALSESGGRRVAVVATIAGAAPADGEAALATIRDLTVTGPVGPVRLGEVARVERATGPSQIVRLRGERAVTISGTITAADLGKVTADVQRAVDGLGLPSGVRVTVGGASELQGDAFGDLFAALAIAVVLVYLALVATFGNLADPLAILFSLPVAVVGAVGALYLTGRALGLPALIGALMLIGIVVTNAIVLLDRVRQERARGLDTRAALIAAGRTRLRPILMTALATILALIPLALGFTKGTIIAAELATVVIGGLLTSTLLTLLVVPVVYSLFDDAARRLRRERASAGPAPAPDDRDRAQHARRDRRQRHVDETDAGEQDGVAARYYRV